MDRSNLQLCEYIKQDQDTASHNWLAITRAISLLTHLAQAEREHPSRLGLRTKEQSLLSCVLVQMESKDKESDLIKDTSA